MEKAKVFFTDFRTRVGTSQGIKLQRLIKKAGIVQCPLFHDKQSLSNRFTSASSRP